MRLLCTYIILVGPARTAFPMLYHCSIYVGPDSPNRLPLFSLAYVFAWHSAVRLSPATACSAFIRPSPRARVTRGGSNVCTAAEPAIGWREHCSQEGLQSM